MGHFGVRVHKQAFNFASGHFLIFADGSREELHGHNYRVFVELEGELDAAQIVLDFRKFKPIVKALCDALDHRTLLPKESPLLTIRSEVGCCIVLFAGDEMRLPLNDVILLPLSNTSAELLAQYFCGHIKEQIRARFPDVYATLARIEVGVEEGPGQMAYYWEEI